MGNGGNYRPMPEDFMEHCRESTSALIRRYHAGGTVVSRWKALAGTLRPWGRGVVRIDEDGKEKPYGSCRAAARDMICGDTSNIYTAIRTGRTAYGYRWRWAEE